MSVFGGFYLVGSVQSVLSDYSEDVDAALSALRGGSPEHYADVEQRPDGASVFRYNVNAVADTSVGQRCALDLAAPPVGPTLAYIAADDPAWIPADVGP